MADTLAYPYVTGFRQGFASISAEFKLPNGKTVTFRGFKGINYTMTRTRGVVRGNHPDPLGKTRGDQEYTCEIEVYVAEFNALLDELGPGWGDFFFNLLVHIVEGGFAGRQDQILGCTLDGVDASQSQGPDPLTRKLTLNPLKILIDGIESLEFPLSAA